MRRSLVGKQKTAYEMLRSLVGKQKTAYEMLRSLVGSEMCIRDRFSGGNGHPRVAGVQHAQDAERGLTLLARRRQVGAQSTEGLGAGHGAQAAGDLEPDLQRADVALGAVVGEWDPQVRGVAQHLVAMAVEPVEQVDVLGSSALAPLAGTRTVLG